MFQSRFSCLLGNPSLRVLGVGVGIIVFGILPPVAGLSTCFLEPLRRLACKFFGFRCCFVGVLARLVSRPVGLFFLGAAIVNT